MPNIIANIIEFNGNFAVINSYTPYRTLIASSDRHRRQWATNFPNATVRTIENVDRENLMQLISFQRISELGPHWVGDASNA